MQTTVDRLEWDEVASAIKPVMVVWSFGTELRWAEYAWGVLADAGLTGYVTEVDRTRCLFRAVALGALYRDFCAHAFDEGTPDDWRDDVSTGLIGPHPLVDMFTLGQLAERSGVAADNAPFDDGREIGEAIRDLVALEYPVVTRELRSRCGDADLFAALWASRDRDTTYPLAGERVSEIVNTDVTGHKMSAWEWLAA